MALQFIKASTVVPGTILSMMAIDIAVNENSDVCVLHEHNFPVPLHHIEYDDETGDLFFVDREGTVTHFGMAVPRQNRNRFSRAREALFLLMNPARRVSGYNKVPVIHRGGSYG
ncbi:MAG TPA: hypothetical protein VL625_00965 [Patescibacteria group bacterium]|jgi:hypothetical protein|nr:hypothetical protein [Patescibacteria group bacterium]